MPAHGSAAAGKSSRPRSGNRAPLAGCGGNGRAIRRLAARIGPDIALLRRDELPAGAALTGLLGNAVSLAGPLLGTYLIDISAAQPCSGC